MTTLREAAQQALEALEAGPDVDPIFAGEAEDALRAALAEPVQERNFCSRCGKRTNDIHTCTPPHEEHFCDTHCTWADHAPGCVRAEPVQEPVTRLFGTLPVYDTPPQRKPLREEKISSLFRTAGSPLLFARAIERAHGIV